MESLKLTGYEPVNKIAFLMGTPTESQFKKSKKSSEGIPQPIEVDGYLIPNAFGIKFYFSSLKSKGLEWSAILEIDVGQDAIPRTISMNVSGDSYLVKGNQRSKLTSPARVERYHLELVSQELRRLEALSIAIAAETWIFSFETNQWHFYFFDNAKDLIQHRKDLKVLEKKVINKTAYRKLDNHFQERISSLYVNAVREQISPYRHIMDVIGREESRVISLKTAQRWVTTARKNGYLQLTVKKKVSASKAGSKPKSKAKKGE